MVALRAEAVTCVRSGFCCKKAPCPYGSGVPCIHLVRDPASTAGQYLCARYEEIKADPGSHWSPAFGAGCSSTLFNDDRDRVIKLGGKAMTPQEEQVANHITRAFELWDDDNEKALPGDEEELRSILVELDAYVTGNIHNKSELLGFATDLLLTMCAYAP